jgi:formyltetrahydrofolate-dependent phosphoribosylglycinamide formyltransferase
VAVLASGSGTNFQALVDGPHRAPAVPVRIVGLLASRPGIGAAERARKAEIPVSAFPVHEFESGTGGPARDEAEERWLLEELGAVDPGLVVLAGYLRKISPAVVEAYRGRMVNIHPALLPSFGGKGMYGMRVHEAVRESGVRITGPTVHFVNEEYDRGAIIAQWPVPVLDDDDPEDIAARVLGVEHRILPAVVRAFARGAFRLTDGGRCRWESDWIGAEGFGPARTGRRRGSTGPGITRCMEPGGT